MSGKSTAAKLLQREAAKEGQDNKLVQFCSSKAKVITQPEFILSLMIFEL